MRLLHAQTLEFEDFASLETTPKYAILSHTWGNEEVTYEDMRVNRYSAISRVGFHKIRGCALQTLKDGLEHFWVDTCCIDKSSSAELSEAINSMFKWYQQAEVCDAYLIDVPLGLGRLADSVWRAKFNSSRWFTRGWTLQELIAPRRLVFYASSWEWIATREILADAIQNRTGIPDHVLCDPTRLARTSVATRMSWASDRQTSRPEDLAYCLMGLFDVNMPMLYGEGEKAFIRLQEEIIKTSDDMSIFAWTDKNASISSFRGLLAKSPSEFALCRDINYTPQSTIPPYRTTNKGIEISVQLDRQAGKHGEHIAWLHGVRNEDVCIGIYVKKVGEKQYARVDPNKLHGGDYWWIRESGGIPLTTFFVRQQILFEEHMDDMDMSRASGIFLHNLTPEVNIMSARPLASWNETKSLVSLSQSLPTTLLVSSIPSDGRKFTLELEIDKRKSWQKFLSADESWTKLGAQSSSYQTFDYTKRHESRDSEAFFTPNIRLSLYREVLNSELRISLFVITEVA